jgi:hypothetical protein
VLEQEAKHMLLEQQLQHAQQEQAQQEQAQQEQAQQEQAQQEQAEAQVTFLCRDSKQSVSYLVCKAGTKKGFLGEKGALNKKLEMALLCLDTCKQYDQILPRKCAKLDRGRFVDAH